MPDIPVIDTHLHLWNPGRLRYTWLDENPLLNQPYLMEDYNEATRGIVVEKMVFVQCECLPSQCEDELAWVTQIAREDPRIRGIIPWAPLEDRGVEDILQRYSQNPLVKGIRRVIQFERDPAHFCTSPAFIDGVRSLEAFGFLFEICIHHSQMESAIYLVDQCPEVTFILDHLGKPGIKSRATKTWKKHLARLAVYPNVYCKISGLVTEAAWDSWKPEDLFPYVRHAIECFGADRVLFGGDWPVVLQASDYRRWVESLDRILPDPNPGLHEKLYYRNAEKVYGI